jgi:hypothetical protein
VGFVIVHIDTLDRGHWIPKKGPSAHSGELTFERVKPFPRQAGSAGRGPS